MQKRNCCGDTDDFKQLFINYVQEKDLDRIEAEYFFERIVDEAAPVGSILRENIDPRVGFYSLFGNL